MMKKILAVLLLGCLLCLALAGCGKTELEKSQEYMDDHPLAEKKLYSVSFALVSDDAIDDATMKAISENFNRFTEANYNIHVEFTNVTAAQYAAWLENRYTAVETVHAARLAEEADVTSKKAELERLEKDAEAAESAVLTAKLEYYVAYAALHARTDNWTADVVAEINEFLDAAREALSNNEFETATSKLNAASFSFANLARKSKDGAIGSDIREVYPEIEEDQFDLVYIANYDMLASLVRAGRLRDLTAELTSNDYRLIKKHMTEKFFEASKLAGKFYAVPNCRVMADYKYLRVNVAKAQEYNYTFQKELSDYSSTGMLRQAITAEGGAPGDFVQKDKIGDYNYRFELAEDGAWWVYGSVNEQLPAIQQSDLMNGMLAVTSYAFVDDNGTVSTTEDDYCPAVRILYAVNTEPVLQSTLRYGAYTTSVVVDGGSRVTVVTPQEGYVADSKYTGNVFALYPTQEEYENNVQAGSRTQNNETRITTDIYAITATSATEGCTAATSSEFGKSGETVTLTATPAEGYTFTQWVVKTDEGEEVKSTSAVYQYVVSPGDIELIAQFEGSAAPVDEEPGE